MRKSEAFALGQKDGYEGIAPRRGMPPAYALGYRMGCDKRDEEKMVAALNAPLIKEDAE